MSEGPKKHHFVPQSLLRRFAADGQRLTVYRVDRDSAYSSSVRDLGHRNHGHTLTWPGRAPNSDLLEARMADLEGEVAKVVDRLCDSTAAIDAEARRVLAWFIALQWQRSRFTLGYLRRAVAESTRIEADSDEEAYLRDTLGLVHLLPLLDAWQVRDDPYASPKERWNGVVSALSRFQWRLVRYRRPVLVVSDNVVCLSGVAAGETADAPPAWIQHGIGVGFGNCRRVTVPLSPQLGVLLDRDQAPKHMQARQFNRLTVFNSREFVAFDAGWPGAEPALHAALLDDLITQRFVRACLAPSA